MRTDKEIQKLIAEFKPPIRKARSVVNDMRVRLHKYRGEDKSAANERLDTLEAMLVYCVAMQSELQDMEEQYHSARMDSAHLKSQLDRARWHIKTSEF